MAESPLQPEPPTAQASLAEAVQEIEEHVAAAGWDAAPRVFALVAAASALASDPSLADQLPADVVAAARDDPHHLFSVEQDGVPAGGTLEELLGEIAWPASVAGAAIVVERLTVPRSVEENMPTDQDEALEYLASHPERQDVRMAVAVLRDGTSWCALRTRANDDAADVAFGADLVPGLVEALSATFED